LNRGVSLVIGLAFLAIGAGALFLAWRVTEPVITEVEIVVLGVIFVFIGSYLVYNEFRNPSARSRDVDHWDALYTLALIIVLPSVGLLGWFAYNQDTTGMSAAGAIVGSWVGAVVAYYFAKDSVAKARTTGESVASARLGGDLTEAELRFNELLSLNQTLAQTNKKLEFDLRQAAQMIAQLRAGATQSATPGGRVE